MSEGVRREVTIVYAFEFDKSSADASEKAARSVEAAQERATRTAETTAKKRSQAQQQSTREWAEKEKAALGTSVDGLKTQGVAVEEMAASYSKFALEREEQNIQLLESTKRISEGVLQVGQSIALMGLASEEDIEYLTRSFVQLRAGIDLIQGGFTTFVELAKHLAIVRKMALGAAAAQKTLTAASAVSGTAGVVGAVGATGTAAAGSAGLATASVAAATTIGTVAVAAGKLALIAVGVYEAGAATARALGATGPASESFVLAVGEMVSAMRSSAAAARQTASLQERFFELSAFRAVADRELAGNLAGLGFREDNFFLGERAANLNRIEAIRQQRDLANRQMGEADTIPGLTADDREARRAKVRERLAQLQEEELETSEQLATLARERAGQTKQEIADARERMNIAKQALTDERSRQQGVLARFGGLDLGRQAELRRIADQQAAGGKLSEKDAKFLQSTGFGGSLVEGYFANRGRARGGDKVFDVLEGGADARAAAQDAMLAAQVALKDAVAADTAARRDEREATREYIAAINALREELVRSREKEEKRRLEAPQQQPPTSKNVGEFESFGMSVGGASVM